MIVDILRRKNLMTPPSPPPTDQASDANLRESSFFQFGSHKMILSLFTLICYVMNFMKFFYFGRGNLKRLTL